MCNDNRTMFAVFHSLIEIEKPSSLTVSHNMNKILSEKCKQSQENFVILSKQSKYLSYPKVFTNNKSEILLSTKL